GHKFNNGRWYDPRSGKWLNEDPIMFRAGDPNLYRYVGNNATNATDPTGHELVGSYEAIRDYKEWLEGKPGAIADKYGKGPGLKGLFMYPAIIKNDEGRGQIEGRWILDYEVGAEAAIRKYRDAAETNKWDKDRLIALTSTTVHETLEWEKGAG